MTANKKTQHYRDFFFSYNACASGEHTFAAGKCTVCGYTCETHSYLTNYANNASRFNAAWGVCDVCGYVDDFHEHVLENGKCKYCEDFEVFEMQVESVFDFDGDGKNEVFTMGNTLPEKFRAEGVKHINAKLDVTSTAPRGEYDEAKGGDTSKLPYPHYYVSDKDLANSYLTYNVEVEKAGIYDLAIHIRLKDITYREGTFTVNGEKQIEFTYGWTEAYGTGAKNTLADGPEGTEDLLSNSFLIGAYIYGFQVELKAGVNEIKITAPGMTANKKTQHYRDFFFSLAEEITCEHDWADATCTAPKTCSKCGATDGAALGHTPKADVAYECATCGEFVGLTALEAAKMGLKLTEGGDPTAEYYYVKVTLTADLGATGFGRVVTGSDVANEYYLGISNLQLEGLETIPKAGDTIILYGQLKCANAAMDTPSGKSDSEGRIHNPVLVEIVEEA